MGSFQQDIFTGNLHQLVDDIILAKLCNMNLVRLTQRPVQRAIYEFCDRLGIMTQTDLPLFSVLRRNQWSEAIRQVGEMEQLIRSHPCNISISYINEATPNGGNRPHRNLQRSELDDWIEAANRTVRQFNPDRMIKPHDGDYDPPEPGFPDHHCYTGWYNGHGVEIGRLHRGYWQHVKKGWYYGCGEFGSEGLDPVPLMRRRYPSNWLPATASDLAEWSPNSIVKSQTGRYHYMWFDTQTSLEDWVRESHQHQAFATRIMTEAFRRDSRMVSTAIHLFIDAFPSGWMKALIDVERVPKPAFFTYRDCCEPVMISLRTDRFSVTSGEEVEVELWICNDTATSPRGARLQYSVRTGEQVLAGGSVEAGIAPSQSSQAGLIKFTAPDTDARSSISIESNLIAADGTIIDGSESEIGLFPRPRKVDSELNSVGLVEREGKAAELIRELGITPITDGWSTAKTIAVDSIDSYDANRDEIDKAAKNGAIIVMLELETGTHQIAGTKVEIAPTGMHEFFFVSRATGHELVSGYEKRDFAFWYDPTVDYISPILGTTCRAPEWRTILSTGIVSWGEEGGSASAALELRHGDGKFRICQVRLPGRTINPVARSFALRMLTK